MIDDAERHRLSLIGRIGAHQLHATHDSRSITQPARDAFRRRFLDQVDPALPEPERLRRADQLRRAHMARMAMRSAEARRRRGPGSDALRG